MPRWLTYTLIVSVIVLVAIAFIAPIGPMPGIRIGGSAAEAPDSWTDTELPEEVRFGTYDGPLPYVVTIWVVESGGRLHVIGAPGSTWVEKATHSPEVRIRIGDHVYDMHANRLGPGHEDIFQTYVDRYQAGYPDIVGDFPPVAEFAREGALFELTPR